MANGANERHLVHVRRHVRQLLANLHARRGSLNGPIDAAKLRRRIGLHVEGIEVRRPAVLVQEDDRLGASAPSPLRRFQERREVCAEDAGGADLQEGAASQVHGIIPKLIKVTSHLL
jgi:hypothetical protein